MIINLPVNALYEDRYVKVMHDIESIREKQLSHGHEITLLGTGSRFYAISDSFLSGMKNSRFLRKYAGFLQKKITQYLIKKGRIRSSPFNIVWTKDVVKSSTMPYPIRRVEYPWSFFNANLDNPMKVLDVGSGISLFPIYLSLQGHDVYSVDNDKILMENLAPRLSQWAGAKVNYIEGDAINLKFPDNTFDRVFCISVLEHLEEESVNGTYVNFRKLGLDMKAIDEMLRVLKPDGLLVLTFDWSESVDDKRSYRLQDICDRLLKPYESLLVDGKKPDIDWNHLKDKHVRAWKSFPPYEYVREGWAIGVVLRKKQA